MENGQWKYMLYKQAENAYKEKHIIYEMGCFAEVHRQKGESTKDEI